MNNLFIEKDFLKKIQEKKRLRINKKMIKQMARYINSNLVEAEENPTTTSFRFSMDRFVIRANITNITEEDLKTIFLEHIRPNLIKSGYKVEKDKEYWGEVYLISWED
jgi:hypothetical protein